MITTTTTKLPPGLYACRVARVTQIGKGAKWSLEFVVAHLPHLGKPAGNATRVVRSWLVDLGLQDREALRLADLSSVVQLVRVEQGGKCVPLDESPEEVERITAELLGCEDLFAQDEALARYHQFAAEQLAVGFGTVRIDELPRPDPMQPAMDAYEQTMKALLSKKRDENVVDRYTRKQAIDDGVLVDVTQQSGPAEMHLGFTVPVAITAALMAALEAIPDRLVGVADVRGRLHDVLWMAALAARRQRGADSVRFVVHLPCRGTRRQKRKLLLNVGPGDHGEPVATIGFPEDF